MATHHALLIGGGLLVLALVIMSARGVASTRRLLIVILLALATSTTSAFYGTASAAGTGEQTIRGYPRPFYFQWSDFEDPERVRRGWNLTYYAANTLMHLGVVSFLGSLLTRRRRRDGDTRMGSGMVALRIALGVFFLILAAIGGLIPILQGWVFFLLAILVLFPKARFTEKVLLKAEPKLPRTVAFLRRLGIGADQIERDTISSE